MTKKRKVCSPPQGDRSDNYEELKEFIVRENSKCVEEIKTANERRIAAVEASLTFALDSITAVSQRQYSADIDIVQLKKESADLRRRLQQLELGEDRIQQEKRLTTLLFSGPAIQAQARREDAVRRINAIVQERMNHTLDSAQVRAMIRLRSGKVLVEFTSASPGSDRDVLFRAKSKLRGSGLFISESLTPRRQAMFLETLQLKKAGIIFSTFTRAGNIFVCRSRDSAPLRVADPEAVRQLAESGASHRPAQGRARVEGAGGLPAPWEEEGARERGRAPSGPSGGAMEVGALSPVGSVVAAPRAVGVGSGRASAADLSPVGSAQVEERGRHGSSPSSLLECAREAAVSLVQLSPPLEETAGVGVATTAASSTAGGTDHLIGVSVAAGALAGSASPVGRPAERELSATGDLVSPVPVTSGVAFPPLTARSFEEGGGRRGVTVSGESPVLGSGERGGGPVDHRPSGGGLDGMVCHAGVSGSESGGVVGAGLVRRGSGAGSTPGVVAGVGETRRVDGASSSSGVGKETAAGVARRVGGAGSVSGPRGPSSRGVGGFKDIREYF